MVIVLKLLLDKLKPQLFSIRLLLSSVLTGTARINSYFIFVAIVSFSAHTNDAEGFSTFQEFISSVISRLIYTMMEPMMEPVMLHLSS